MATPPSFETLADGITAARAAKERGDVKEAAQIYRDLPKAFPTKKNAVAFASDGLQDCGQWTEAIALLENALAHMPVSALILTRLAKAYHGIEDDRRAAIYLQRYLDHDPRNPDVWMLLAQYHAGANQWVEAEAAFRQAQTLEPMNAEAAVGRGNAQFTLGQVDEAIGSYRRALAIEPNNAAVLFKIGSALLNTGRWEEALPALSKSVSLDGQNARAYANFGIALFNAGQLAPAVQAAQTAIALDPGLQIGRLLSGILASEQGHLDDALAILKEATRSKGENAEALITLAAVAAASGEILEAERALQRALADDGHMLEARHLLAALHDEAIVAPLDGYVAQMFDRIAPQYDAYQLNVAAYQVPQELVGIIEDTQPDRRSIASIIDAGCGTGLTVAALQDAFAIDAAIGIDCSQRMLEQAQTKGLYEEVLLGTLPDAFDALSGQVELITATDLFPYLGDLAPFMALAGQHLIPGGLLACSFEHSPGREIQLAPSGRFTHTAGYVESLAGTHGLRPLAARPIVLRRTLGRPVEGTVALFERSP